ncbi:4-diphosphocytidyl-2-C-methyl-D-erythritol kinase [gut metagenome]|uniref:4-(cytidine 5'-diphospho)-2-C-methyl-D-erythritol kinase n=1 Tax=gut metagenome TaxID=749906 RepID=J9GLW0_9ZZZZ
MITFPNAKINLGLSITEKRPDGYHNLETVFYPIPVEDALEVVKAPLSERKWVLHQSGMTLEGEADQNLVVKAYQLLDADFGLEPVEIFLHKLIPSGAGLGGGSADAAFMLRMLNELFELKLSTEQLEAYAVRLGADCAFFIQNRPTFAEGVGNVFSPINLSLKGYQYVLVKPDIFVSTREAFAHITPHRPEHAVKETVLRPMIEWRDRLVNDFEASVFPQFPAIGELKKLLYSRDALYASMSGSGSSVFALFAPDAVLPNLKFDEGTFYRQGKLRV